MKKRIFLNNVYHANYTGALMFMWGLYMLNNGNYIFLKAPKHLLSNKGMERLFGEECLLLFWNAKDFKMFCSESPHSLCSLAESQHELQVGVKGFSRLFVGVADLSKIKTEWQNLWLHALNAAEWALKADNTNKAVFVLPQPFSFSTGNSLVLFGTQLLLNHWA